MGTTPTQQSPIAANPTWVPTRKWSATNGAAAVMICTAWIVHAVWPNLVIPAEVALSFSYLVTSAIGYFIPNSQQ